MEPHASPFRRNLPIVGGVLLLHGLALWALQSGLMQRVVDLVVPVEVLAEAVELPQPKSAPPPPPPRAAEPVKPMAHTAAPLAAPPAPVALADTTPASNAPSGVTAPQPAPPTMAVAAAAVAPVAVHAPTVTAPPKVELPSSDADYLQNPRPEYPSLSKRRGEQGKVLLHVLIGTDGSAQKAEIRQSSGFERLDQAALTTVLRWRYVPGKRGGVPEAMWFNVPLNFVLE